MKTTKLIPNELRQLIALCVSTYYNLYGENPSIQELCKELGSQFSSLLVNGEYEGPLPLMA